MSIVMITSRSRSLTPIIYLVGCVSESAKLISYEKNPWKLQEIDVYGINEVHELNL